MKTQLLASFILVFMGTNAIGQDQYYVEGHYKKNGTWVEGYYKTKANKTKSDNYSTEGNYNPYTGREGKKKEYSDPYAEPKKRRTKKIY